MKPQAAESRDGTLAGRVSRFDTVALALLVALVAIALFGPLYQIGIALERPNEGWNATHALQAFGPDLYPPPGSFIINNYTPLWFYLTGLLARIFGDPIFPGRVVALLALAATACAIFAILQRLGASTTAGLVGGLSYVATMAGHYGGWVGLAEPQILAHALAAAGATVSIRARGWRSVLGGALLMVLGGLTKQTVIALPLASGLWLFAFRRPLFLPWLAGLVILAVVAIFLLLAGYGNAFVYNVAFPRQFSIHHLATNLSGAVRLLSALCAIGTAAWIGRRRPDTAMAFVGFAVAGGFADILVFGGALGVSQNICFDLVISASIGFGLAWDRLAGFAGSRSVEMLRFAFLIAFLLQTGAELFHGDSRVFFDPAERRRLAEISASMAALRGSLAMVASPVACEHLSECLWAGHPSEVDLWKLRHETTLAELDRPRLLARIAGSEFGAISAFGYLSGPQDDGKLPGLWAALQRGYGVPIHYGGFATLFLPKDRSAP